VFGPSAAAAQLEGSKSFAKAFMQRHRIPTAAFAVFEQLEAARAYVRQRANGCVVKADGLAAGKGVAVCETPEQALAALDEAMGQRRFGAAVIVVTRSGSSARRPRTDDHRREHAPAPRVAGPQADRRRRSRREHGETAWPCRRRPSTPQSRRSRAIVYPAIRGLAADGMPSRRAVRRLMIDARRSARDRVQRAVRRSRDAAVGCRWRATRLLLDGAARGALVASPAGEPLRGCVVPHPRAIRARW
jgi:phosphoribosylamine--glycine ligase